MLLLAVPLLAEAQGVSGSIYKLNDVLDKLFEQMLPKCERLIDVGRAIGGLGALGFIAFKVWKNLAQAEPVDVFPLLRPFGIGMAIVFFPALIGMMNGVIKPVCDATYNIAGDSRKAVLIYIEQQEKGVKEPPPVGTYLGAGGNDMDKYEQPDGTSENGIFTGLQSAFSMFNVKNLIMMAIMEGVQILYCAASLVINTIRTFYLLVLAILGPLALALSIFPGFDHTLVNWFARYINISMWLPVANIFAGITAGILENMKTLDQNFFSSIAYIIFLIISIIGYLSVPSVANYIVQAGDDNTLLHKINDMTRQAGKAAAAALI